MISSSAGERRAGRWSTATATVAASLYLVFGTSFLGLCALLLSWIPPRGKVVFWFARVWAKGWLKVARIRLRVTFEEPLEPDGRYVFMPNHASYLDIPVIIATSPVEARFMAKRSLFRLPIIGQAMRSGGFIGVDRQDRSRARETLQAAVDTLQEEASILIFPEGTRTRTGRLQPFKRGGFLIALRSERPIVPVGIRGSFEAQPSGTWVVRPGDLTVRYGRPVETVGRGVAGRGELSDEVWQRVAELSGEAAV